MRPSEILGQARSSAIRIRRIDEELETLRSRVGGQGTGFGTSIDHNVVLDPLRNLDELLEAEESFAYEVACCREDVCAAETLIAGAEPLIVSCATKAGLDLPTAAKNAADMCYCMRAYYVEACTMDELCAKTGYERRANEAMLRYCREWCDYVGIAHMKAGIAYDDRTPEELRAAYQTREG